MLKTKKEVAYFIAILAVLAAIVGVILFGLHLKRSAAEAAAAPPAPTTEEKQGFSLVKEEEKTSFETVQDGLRDMGQLVTEEYHFTEVTTYSKLKTFLGINIPWAESNYVASYDGVILAGIDFSEITVETLSLGGKTHLTVKLPKAEIQSTDIDPNSFVLYSEKSGLGNPLSAADFNQSLTELEQDVQQKALDKGILDRAYAQAKLIVESFVRSVLAGQDFTLEVE